MQDGSGEEELMTRMFNCNDTNRAADVKLRLTGESLWYELQEINDFLLKNSTTMTLHSSTCPFEDVSLKAPSVVTSTPPPVKIIPEFIHRQVIME